MSAPDQNRGQKLTGFRRGLFFTSTGSVINLAFLFLETTLAARLLLPSEYGVYILLMTVVSFLVIIIDLGFRNGLTTLIAGSEGDRQVMLANTALTFRLVCVMTAGLLVWAGHSAFALLDPSGLALQYAQYVPIVLLVTSLDELLAAILRGFQSYRHFAVAQIVRSSLRLGLTLYFLLVLELGTFGIICSWTLAYAVSALYQYLALPVARRFAWDRALLRELLRFGFPSQVSGILWFVYGGLQVFLLSTLAGPVSVAYYTVATRIPDALQRLSESYIAVYFPTVAALLGKGQRAQAVQLLNNSLRLVSFLTALGAVVAVVFGEEIITLLFSEKYVASGPAFAVLMVAFHMVFMVSLMGYTLTASGNPRRSLQENLTRTSLSLAGNLALIPRFGFMGSVSATLLSAYLASPVAVWLLRRSGFAVALAPLVKQTAILLLCGTLVWWHQPSSLVLKVALVLGALALSFALGIVRRSDLRMVVPEGVLKRLRPPGKALSGS